VAQKRGRMLTGRFFIMEVSDVTVIDTRPMDYPPGTTQQS
jgi:hypothetical protein